MNSTQFFWIYSLTSYSFQFLEDALPHFSSLLEEQTSLSYACSTLFPVFIQLLWIYHLEFQKWVLQERCSAETWTWYKYLILHFRRFQVLETESGLIKEIWCLIPVGLGSFSPDLAVVPSVADERVLSRVNSENGTAVKELYFSE